jgi:hypothetical protein
MLSLKRQVAGEVVFRLPYGALPGEEAVRHVSPMVDPGSVESPPLRRSGSGLLQIPRPGLLPWPNTARLGPLGPLRGVLSTRQSSRSLRPAASLLLASTPGSRPTPEVDYRLLWRLARAGLPPAGRLALRWARHNTNPRRRSPDRPHRPRPVRQAHRQAADVRPSNAPKVGPYCRIRRYMALPTVGVEALRPPCSRSAPGSSRSAPPGPTPLHPSAPGARRCTGPPPHPGRSSASDGRPDGPARPDPARPRHAPHPQPDPPLPIVSLTRA